MSSALWALIPFSATYQISYISSGEKPVALPSQLVQKPSQLRWRHLACLGGGDGAVAGGVAVGAGVRGGRIIGVDDAVCKLLVVFASSQQPQNLPGVSQVEDEDVLIVDVVDVVVISGSVVLSLHPNQPGVSQVDVDVVEVVEVVVIVAVAVVLSKQPHQPGVSHVVVRVRVRVVVVAVDAVVVSVPLLSYIFHCAQSRHSGVKEHSGTSS
jgi:hypothetical protein